MSLLKIEKYIRFPYFRQKYKLLSMIENTNLFISNLGINKSNDILVLSFIIENTFKSFIFINELSFENKNRLALDFNLLLN